MDAPVSKSLRITFLVHVVAALVLGAALLLIPGRTLVLVGWVPYEVQLPESVLKVPGQTFVDPAITRVFGAALLALGWASFQGWQAKKRAGTLLPAQIELAFCVLGAAGMVYGLVQSTTPAPVIGWVLAAFLAVSAVFFGLGLRR